MAGQCPTRASIASNMRKVTSYNPGGLDSTAIQYSPGTTPDGNPDSCLYFYKIGTNSIRPHAQLPDMCVTDAGWLETRQTGTNRQE